MRNIYTLNKEEATNENMIKLALHFTRRKTAPSSVSHAFLTMFWHFMYNNTAEQVVLLHSNHRVSELIM